MVSALIIFSIIGALIVTGLIIWLLVVIFRDKEEEKDRNMALNFMSNYSNGRAYGQELSVDKSFEGRFIITFMPKDITSDSLKTLKAEKIIVDKGKLISLPRGTWSKEKNISIYLPIRAEDFPDALKQTEFGKMLMLFTEMKNSVNSEVDMVREGSRRKDDILKRIGDGELSGEILDANHELIKELIKMMAENRTRDKQPSGGSAFNQIPPSSP
jgi:hypothetical protein